MDQTPHLYLNIYHTLNVHQTSRYVPTTACLCPRETMAYEEHNIKVSDENKIKIRVT